MELRFSEDHIKCWAKKYVSPEPESSLISQQSAIKNSGFLTQDQLISVARWKAPRIIHYIKSERNSEDVKDITSFSFSVQNERIKIEVLTLLDGVSWPMASAILHWFDKGEYPILDFRALWSVRLNMPTRCTFSFWWEYVKFCRAVAQRNSVDMRTLDRALWQYSRENQKKNKDLPLC